MSVSIPSPNSISPSTKSNVVIANAAAGLSAAVAAQLVWTSVDVVSQRLMVQGCCNSSDPHGQVFWKADHYIV